MTIFSFDSFLVSCFGNQRPDSRHYFIKCFTVHVQHFLLSGNVLHWQFFHQFQPSAPVFHFDPFRCPSSLPPKLSRFIFHIFVVKVKLRLRLGENRLDFLDYKAKKNRATFEMKKARQEFYTDFIAENSHDTRKLFRVYYSLFFLLFVWFMYPPRCLVTLAPLL